MQSHAQCFDEDSAGRSLLIDRERRIIHACGNVCSTMSSDLLIRLSEFSRGSTDPVLLIVNSNGGNLSDGLAMVDLIRASSVPVHSLVMGLCCSAATLFSSVCVKRYTFPNSFFLIHEIIPSPNDILKFHEVVEDSRVMKDMMDQMLAIYRSATGASVAQIRKNLAESKWFNAREAVAYGSKGLVDKVIKTIPQQFTGKIASSKSSKGK